MAYDQYTPTDITPYSQPAPSPPTVQFSAGMSSPSYPAAAGMSSGGYVQNPGSGNAGDANGYVSYPGSGNASDAASKSSDNAGQLAQAKVISGGGSTDTIGGSTASRSMEAPPLLASYDQLYDNHQIPAASAQQNLHYAAKLAVLPNPETGRPFFSGPVTPKGVKSGAFTAAVVDFQNAYGLIKDGLIGVGPGAQTGPGIDQAHAAMTARPAAAAVATTPPLPPPRPASSLEAAKVQPISSGVQEAIAARAAAAPLQTTGGPSLESAGVTEGLQGVRRMTAGMEEMPSGPNAPLTAAPAAPAVPDGVTPADTQPPTPSYQFAQAASDRAQRNAGSEGRRQVADAERARVTGAGAPPSPHEAAIKSIIDHYIGGPLAATPPTGFPAALIADNRPDAFAGSPAMGYPPSAPAVAPPSDANARLAAAKDAMAAATAAKGAAVSGITTPGLISQRMPGGRFAGGATQVAGDLGTPQVDPGAKGNAFDPSIPAVVPPPASSEPIQIDTKVTDIQPSGTTDPAIGRTDVGHPPPARPAIDQAREMANRPPEGGGVAGWFDRNVRYPLGIYMTPEQNAVHRKTFAGEGAPPVTRGGPPSAAAAPSPTKSLEAAKVGGPAMGATSVPAGQGSPQVAKVMNILGLPSGSPEMSAMGPPNYGYKGVPSTDIQPGAGLSARTVPAAPRAATGEPADFYRGVIKGPAEAPGVQGSAAPYGARVRGVQVADGADPQMDEMYRAISRDGGGQIDLSMPGNNGGAIPWSQMNQDQGGDGPLANRQAAIPGVGAAGMPAVERDHGGRGAIFAQSGFLYERPRADQPPSPHNPGALSIPERFNDPTLDRGDPRKNHGLIPANPNELPAVPTIQGGRRTVDAGGDTKQQMLDQIAKAPPERRQAAAEHAMALGAAAHQMIGASPEQQGKILDGLVADGTLDKAKADEMRRNPPPVEKLTQVFDAGIAVYDKYHGGESALSGAKGVQVASMSMPLPRGDWNKYDKEHGFFKSWQPQYKELQNPYTAHTPAGEPVRPPEEQPFTDQLWGTTRGKGGFGERDVTTPDEPAFPQPMQPQLPPPPPGGEIPTSSRDRRRTYA